MVGAPVVLFATLVSVVLLPPIFWSLTGVVQFVSFFLWHSLRGGVNVARLALHPRLPISPGMHDQRAAGSSSGVHGEYCEFAAGHLECRVG
ncbi:MAG TPA: hypothetical protein ENI68_08920 [Gammaproteobacteria bacterium]|nr:hypothetical protein [Gammaproteobacteria bacterium]